MILKIGVASRATIRDITFNSNFNCDRAVVEEVADLPGDRVNFEQLRVVNQRDPGNTWASILVYGQKNSVVNIDTTEINYGGAYPLLGSRMNAAVYANTPVGSPFTGGRTLINAINIGGYAVFNNAHLLVTDGWYEDHPVARPYMNMNSSGTLTFLGNLIAPCTGSPNTTPGIDVTAGFQGRLAILSTVFTHNNATWPTPSPGG